MMLYVFIHGLTGKVFKILPLKEETDAGRSVFLDDYIGSLIRDVTGAEKTFPCLAQSNEYITILNTLQYLNSEDFDRSICKQEVFKMLRLLNTIEAKVSQGELE